MSRETKFSGANADREKFVFPVQLTTCRIDNLTRLIYTWSKFSLPLAAVGRSFVYTTNLVIGSVPSFSGSRNCVPMAFTAERPPAQGQ